MTLLHMPASPEVARTTHSTYGYNFFACRPSSVFVATLMALA